MELQRATDEATARVEKAHQRQEDVQVAIAKAPAITAQLLVREDRAARAEQRAVQQLDEVAAETTAVLKAAAFAQKQIAPRRFEVLEVVTFGQEDRLTALARCLQTGTLQAYYRSNSGMLWHLARETYTGQLMKSERHYTGGFVASWPMQNLLNAAAAKAPPRVIPKHEFGISEYYPVMMRHIFVGEHAVWDLLENSCFSAPHPLLATINRAFPCPMAMNGFIVYGGLDREDEVRPEVANLLDGLFPKPQATALKDGLLGRMTVKQSYEFVRDVLDAYMRKHFERIPNVAEIQVVSPFSTPFLEHVSVVKRTIRSKQDADARFNVFIALYQVRDAPPHLQGRKFEQVILIQRKGHVDDALEKLADTYGVMYCFAPAGQLTCKPLEYLTQTIGKKNKQNPAEVMSYGHYKFVGEFLAGVFPAMQLGQSGPAAKAQVHEVDLIDLTRERDAKYARERNAKLKRERNVKYARESDDVIDLSGGFGTLRREERRIRRTK